MLLADITHQSYTALPLPGSLSLDSQLLSEAGRREGDLPKAPPPPRGSSGGSLSAILSAAGHFTGVGKPGSSLSAHSLMALRGGLEERSLKQCLQNWGLIPSTRAS